MAERVGFEPTEPLRAQHVSTVSHSTTLAPLQKPQNSSPIIAYLSSLSRPFTFYGLTGQKLTRGVIIYPEVLMPEFYSSSAQSSAEKITPQTPLHASGTAGFPQQVRTLLEWEAPSRIFVPRDKKYFSNLGLIILIAGVVLIFFKEVIIILVILALAFVAYVLATVPPEKIRHKITTQGLVSAEHSYFWKDLQYFWFDTRHGTTLLMIDTNLRFPARLIILLDKGVTKEKLISVLSPYLHYEEAPKPHWSDRSAGWLAAKLNLH